MEQFLNSRLSLQDATWLFLLGVNNSGTTVMSRLIGSHSEISAMEPEGQHVTQELPHAWRLGVARLWTERLDVFRWTEENSGEPAARVKFDWAFYLSGNRYLFEKSPPHTVRSRWLQEHFAPATFLAAVRHPYAVCEGICRREGCTMARAAKHWVSANRIMLEDAPHLKRFMLVRYEDFCASPRKQLADIARFLELGAGYSDSIIEKEFSIHNADNATQTVSNLNAGSFRRLTAKDVREINEIAGELMAEFGYDIERPESFDHQ